MGSNTGLGSKFSMIRKYGVGPKSNVIQKFKLAWLKTVIWVTQTWIILVIPNFITK